ncbi:GNAT family N-acetyltransferase [Variovorax sp. J22R24]|uniref:GNAT family N-acetyltransferase n=1 Tax=Variovorax gracilis TaxID=3053502 RepID=UPI002575FC8E|nr:GNAT family N-acetyltransferase [Variovorax sp. J22R24]MDM0103436.1 GNAT family N-acetyltransferase [Variovorax sp. J22R24]
MNDTTTPRAWPRKHLVANATIQVDLLSPRDGVDVARFVQKLPTHDLLFVRRDVSHPKVVTAWLDAIAQGSITSLAARCNGELVGCTAIVTDPRSWSRHVAELRVMVSPAWRGRGLGRLLTQECFALALGLGLEKLYVQMTVDQRSAIAVFEELGFRAEAVLRDHVKDRDGTSYDLAILSHHVAEVQSRFEVYGVADALGG